MLPAWSADLTALTFDELLRLKRALEGSEGIVIDRGLYKAVLDAIWVTEAVKPITSWPETTLENGLRVIHFCTEAKSPEDAAHQPVACLSPKAEIAHFPSLGELAGDWNTVWYQCSCGVRDGNAGILPRATGRRWRVKGTPPNWLCSDSTEAAALNLRDVAPGMLLVCRAAENPDDRAHGHSTAYPGCPPDEGSIVATFICICGCSSDDDEIQQIPCTITG